jgi:hypothetical protein
MENQITSHIYKGVILGVVSILTSVVVHVFNLYQNTYVNLISLGIFIIGIIYSCILFSNQNKNNVQFGNIFAHGFKTTSVVIVITSLYTILTVKFIFPEIIDISLNLSRKGMESNPNIPKDTIEQNVDFVRKYFIPLTIGFSMAGTAFIGLIASLIGAAVSKKKSANPFQNSIA